MNPAPSAGVAALPAFTVARLPRIEFGPGRFSVVPEAVARHGQHVLLVTGGRSFRASGRWEGLVAALDGMGIAHEELRVEGEPSPDSVDEAVARFRGGRIDVVLGIGGGSALDTAKAVAGLLATGTSARDHLEGVGPGLPYPGPATPFIAVPTTAGTGSEATKNAVLSVRREGGFKRSFRDERLVAREAMIDPDLLVGCPPALIAADGLDALTQLLESYVSLGAGPFTDALALSGLEAARDGLLEWHRAAVEGADAPDGRVRMAYAALLSGICLAQAGLGAVHGFAAALGAYFPIPHGAACGATLVAAVEANLAALEAREPASPALERYARLGRLLGRLPEGTPGPEARRTLVERLGAWTGALRIPGLAAHGVGSRDVERLVGASRGSSMRTNPIALRDDELAAILERSL